MTESAPAADWSWQDDPNVISWDWRQGPDLDELRDLLARHGLSVTEVNTGTDDVAVRITRVQPARVRQAKADRDHDAEVDRVPIERFGYGPPVREVLVTAMPDQRTSGGDLP